MPWSRLWKTGVVVLTFCVPGKSAASSLLSVIFSRMRTLGENDIYVWLSWRNSDCFGTILQVSFSSELFAT